MRQDYSTTKNTKKTGPVRNTVAEELEIQIDGFPRSLSFFVPFVFFVVKFL